MADEVPIKYAAMISIRGSTETDAAIGLYSGSLCWITGDDVLATYDNLPINPVTLAEQEDWEIGMLAADSFGSPSFDVNMESLGSYGDQSELELKANFVRLTSEWMYDHSLYRARVQFFVVVGTTFKKWCEQVVESFRYNSTVLAIYCMDVSKDVHRDIPSEKTSRAAYPSISEDNEDKYIPITIGRVAKAACLPVSQDGDRLPMYKKNSVEYPTTAATKIPLPAGATEDYRKIYIKMIVGDLVVAANQWAGKWLACTRNGPNQQVEVLGNTASSGGYVVVQLVSAFTVGNTDTTIKYWSDENVPAEGKGFDATWFQLHSQEFAHVVSYYPVHEFPDLRQVFFWDDDGKRFWSAFNTLKSAHPSGIPGYGDRPGIVTQGSDPKLSGATTQSYFPITPKAVRFVSLVVTDSAGASHAELTLPSEDFPVAPGDCAELYDIDKATAKTWTSSKTTTSNRVMRSTLVLDVELPDDFDFDAGLDGLFLAFNTSHEFNCADSVKMEVTKRWTIIGNDILRANGEAFDPGTNLHLIRYKNFSEGFLTVTFDQVPADNEVSQNGILDDYFGDYGSRGNFFQNQSRFLLSKLTLDKRALENVWGLRFTLHCDYNVKTLAGVAENTHIYDVVNKISEIALYGVKKVDGNPKQVLLPVVGDKFQGTWGGRRTSGDPILNIVDAVEQIIRQYDGRADLIDVTTFNQAVTDRPLAGWGIGRQIWEGKNSIEYLRELCAEGHFCITAKHDGTRAIRSWLDRTGSTLIDEDAIVEDSIGEIEDVDLRLVYNQFELRYDKNYAGDNDYRRTVAVRHVDEDAFPAEDETVPTNDGAMDIEAEITGYVRDDGRVTFFLSGPNPMIKAGMFVTLTGGEGGFALDKAEILEAQHYYDFFWAPVSFFTVLDTGSFGALTEGVTYTTIGTFTLYPNTLLLWKTYVVGIDDYDTAKDEIWDPCHAAWVISGTKNTLRMDFNWFGSNADWGGDPLNDGPVSWLKKVIGSLVKPFKKADFQLPITLGNLDLEAGQGIDFGHAVYTDGRFHYAWIQRMVLNSEEDRIDMEIIFNPWTSH